MIYRGLQSGEKSDLDGHEAEKRNEKGFSLHPHFILLLGDVWRCLGRSLWSRKVSQQ